MQKNDVLCSGVVFFLLRARIVLVFVVYLYSDLCEYILNMENISALIYYLMFINIVTFFVYGIDKVKAKKNKRRISEATLLMLAVVGGTIGALLAMNVWHHKTMHKKFKYGLPLILLVQIVLIFLI